jgi:hypothetical protein
VLMLLASAALDRVFQWWWAWRHLAAVATSTATGLTRVPGADDPRRRWRLGRCPTSPVAGPPVVLFSHATGFHGHAYLPSRGPGAGLPLVGMDYRTTATRRRRRLDRPGTASATTPWPPPRQWPGGGRRMASSASGTRWATGLLMAAAAPSCSARRVRTDLFPDRAGATRHVQRAATRPQAAGGLRLVRGGDRQLASKPQWPHSTPTPSTPMSATASAKRAPRTPEVRPRHRADVDSGGSATVGLARRHHHTGGRRRRAARRNARRRWPPTSPTTPQRRFVGLGRWTTSAR